MHFRPHLLEVLKQLAQNYELILLSNSSKEITNKIVDYLERDGSLFSFRLTREACYLTDNKLFIKDLRIISRPIETIVLVDDCTYSFGFQIDNGIPIIPFTGNKEDCELLLLLRYLDYLMKHDDVRKVNRDQFKFHLYSDCKNVEEVYKKIFKE